MNKEEFVPTQIKLDLDENFYYRLTTNWQGEGKSLDVVNEGEHSTQIQLADSAKVTGQCWRFKHLYSNHYKISCQFRGEDWPLTQTNSATQLHPIITIPQIQTWRLRPEHDGYYRISCESKGNEFSLDVVNDGVNNNRIHLSPSGNYSGQLWKLTKLKPIN